MESSTSADSNTNAGLQQLRSPPELLRPRRGIWDFVLARPRITADARPTERLREPPTTAKKRIGICCSGGGIRSAAYNLGALQVLNDRGKLREASYISAVSGGAYLAASYAIVGAFSEEAVLGEQPIYESSSPEEQHLRDRSSYVAPNFKGKVNLLVTLLGGIAINVGLLALVTFLVARALAWLYLWRIHVGSLAVMDYTALGPTALRPDQPKLHPTTAVAWTLKGLVVTTLVLFIGQLLRPQHEPARRFLVAWTRRLAVLTAVLFIFLIALPETIVWLREHLPYVLKDLLPSTVEGWLGIGQANPSDAVTSPGMQPLQVLTAILGISWVAAGLRSLLLKHVSKVAMIAGGVVVPLFVLGLFLNYLNGSLILGPPSHHVPASACTPWPAASCYHDPLWQWVGLAVVFALIYTFADLTNWSGHPFYKRRLSSAFVTKRCKDGQAEEVPYQTLVSLERSQPPQWRDSNSQPHPELIICAAANVTDPDVLPPGRAAESFTFSPRAIGGQMFGSYSTHGLDKYFGRRLARNLTLPAAMAMSGAAFSPSMGKMTYKSLSALMTLMNLRLGVWIPNPRGDRWRKKPNRFERWFGMRPRLRYLLKELTRTNRLDAPYLYVTDGGHYENLGLVELLRRGCTEIYCFDASGGPADTFHTFGEAIELARAEPDVRVHVQADEKDLEAMVPQGTAQKADAGDGTTGPPAFRDGLRLSTRDFATVPFDYRDVRRTRHVEELDETYHALFIQGEDGTELREEVVIEDTEGDVTDNVETVRGTIYYCRAALTADAPWDVLDCATRDKNFPHDPTTSQLFTELAFESYRMLGAHTATHVLAEQERAASGRAPK